MKKTILVVDDEPHILILEKELLEGAGYKVVTAEDGKAALAKLKTLKPDLVILDMMMPGMSGREVCEQIRKNPKTKGLKVVFVTVARFSEIGKKQLEDLKVLDYITKPFENADYLARVKKSA